MTHSFEQPSPATVFPSSHASMRVFRLFLHTSIQLVCPQSVWMQSHPVSCEQPVLQPSPFRVLLSSHTSLPASLPSPHSVLQCYGAPASQTYPHSMAHTSDHPSPAAVLPSSHSSPGVTWLFPHTSLQCDGPQTMLLQSHSTAAAAAITVFSVAVVTRLVVRPDRVAAGCGEGVGSICQPSIATIPTLYCAIGRAPITCSNESVITKIVHVQLCTKREAITTNLVACHPYAIGPPAQCVGALKPGFYDASLITISRFRVSIVACLRAGNNAIPTGFDRTRRVSLDVAIPHRIAALETTLYSARGGSPVERDGAAVVRCLARSLQAVSIDLVTHGVFTVGVGTQPPRLYDTAAAATIAIILFAVITALVPSQFAVAAGGCYTRAYSSRPRYRSSRIQIILNTLQSSHPQTQGFRRHRLLHRCACHHRIRDCTSGL